jgi:hypothetical protein
MGERRGVYTVLLENTIKRDHLGDQGVDGRIILRWIFRKWDMGVCTGSMWLRIGTVGGHFVHGNETSGSMKRGEFFDYLRTC